ncbi:MAG: hypothetical protein AAGK14_01075 [Verrucomicrobiota bacterium]
MLALVALLAWPLYAALGLPWLLGLRPGWWRLAPLVGAGLAGLGATWAWMLGLPAAGGLAGAVLAAAVPAAIYLRRPSVRRELATALPAVVREGLAWYLLSLFVMSLSPFPILGPWGIDWHMMLRTGECVLLGLPLERYMLPRPAMAGAGAVPLWLLEPGLPTFQVFGAVLAAGGLAAGVALARETFRRDDHSSSLASWRLAYPLALSPFFLLHATACWGKLLSGGLAAAAIGLMITLNRQSDRTVLATWWPPALLFGLAVATHPGALVMLPLVLLAARPALAERLDIGWWCRWGGRLLLVGLALILFYGVYDLWTSQQYGAEAKRASNPAFDPVQRAKFGGSVLLNTLATLVTNFISLWPFDPVTFDLLRAAGPDSTVFLVGWNLVIFATVLASTFVGQFWPFLALRVEGRGLWVFLREQTSIRWGVGLAGVLVAHAIILANVSPHGTAQNALLGISLLGFGWVLAFWEQAVPATRARVLRLTFYVGTLAWLLPNAISLVAIRYGFLGVGHQMDDDYGFYHAPLELPLVPVTAFPWLQLVLLGLTVLAWRAKGDPAR